MSQYFPDGIEDGYTITSCLKLDINSRRNFKEPSLLLIDTKRLLLDDWWKQDLVDLSLTSFYIPGIMA